MLAVGLSLRFVSRSSQVITRKEPRYDLRLPVSLRLINRPSYATSGVSVNISVHGILLSTHSAISEGSELELVITLRTARSSQTVRLAASGRVLRLERRKTGDFAAAVDCAEHPFRLTRAG